MLNFTDVNLKPISGIAKFQFTGSTGRGHISMICEGCTETNNKCFKFYNLAKPISCIIYLEASNLYGHSMMQLPPTEVPEWVNLKDFDLDNYSSNLQIVCLSEVDLDYPDKLHNLYDDYHLAGEKIKVTEEMFSKFQLQIIKGNYISFFLVKTKNLFLI